MPPVHAAPERHLLFLCTGNYYRSRFAEELWQHLETRQPTGWRAQSRGISFVHSRENVGPISPHARWGLQARGIELDEPLRAPRLVEPTDLAGAAHIVAMSRQEHRPMLLVHFPIWTDRVECWDVEDVALWPPEVALERIERWVRELRVRLVLRDG